MDINYLIHLRKKVFDPILIFNVVKHYKPLPTCSDKTRNMPIESLEKIYINEGELKSKKHILPFVKLVHYFKVHIWCFKHVFVYEIQCCIKKLRVSTELCNMNDFKIYLHEQ